MFVGGGNTPEEVILQINNNMIALGGEEKFNEFLSTKFPQCSEHYRQRREQFGATWNIDPALLAGLFEYVEDRAGILDYILCQINPNPNQRITLDDLNGGVTMLNGKSVVDIFNYFHGEGLERKFEIYQR